MKTTPAVVAALTLLLAWPGVAAPPGAALTPEPVLFEVRLISDEPIADWTVHEGEDGETFYLSPDAELTNADIEQAWYEPGAALPSIGLFLTEQGALKLARLTTDNVGHRIAMMLDGEVVAAPVVRAPLTAGRALITGDFDEDEARAMAASLDPDRDATHSNDE